MSPSGRPPVPPLASLGLLLLLAAPARPAEGPPRVAVLETPGGGLQPQALADEAGAIHLLYYQGKEDAGDLFYAQRPPGASAFSKPVRVNSAPGSAIAVGTVRGGQMALGRGGRVHVAWNGATGAQPANPIKGVPMLYARSDPGGTAFEPQRNLMQRSFHLDGGGSVAADGAGNVYVVWHGASPDEPPGEEHRRLWLARSGSGDDGATFEPERAVDERPVGACACCGVKVLADRRGALDILYRSATQSVHRDLWLVTSRDRGDHTRAHKLDLWPATVCPMSTESLADTPAGLLAAWENPAGVAFTRFDPRSAGPGPILGPPGNGRRKHPALAANARGEVLLAWAEGTGWKRGGALAWQVWDATLTTVLASGREDGGIPVWGLPTAVACADGGFLIIH